MNKENTDPMTATTAVATTEKGGVPALVRPGPALEITAEDVTLPRLYIGQFMSESVKNQLVTPGSLYLASGADDPDPNVLWDPKKDKDKGPTVYVLALNKGKSITVNGELETFAYNDPAAPADAWITYNYTIAIPDVDDQVPFKWLLTRTARPTAKQINTVLVKNDQIPAWHNAFRVHTDKRENAKGEYFVPRITVVEPVKADVAVAESLAGLISGASADIAATGEEPAI